MVARMSMQLSLVFYQLRVGIWGGVTEARKETYVHQCTRPASGAVGGGPELEMGNVNLKLIVHSTFKHGDVGHTVYGLYLRSRID